MFFYEQQYLLDIHIIPMISWQFVRICTLAFLKFLSFSTPRIGLQLFDTNFPVPRKRNMLGIQAHLQENDNLPLW